MNLYILTSGLLLSAASLLFFSLSKVKAGVQAEKLGHQLPEKITALDIKMLENKILRKSRKLWSTQTLRTLMSVFDLWLRQSGCVTKDQKVLRLTLFLVMHIISLFVSVIYIVIFSEEKNNILMIVFLVQVVTFIIAIGLMYIKILQRKEAIEQHVETLIQITKMFWDTGMTLESVLKHSIDALETTSPEISQELYSVLLRVETGYNRSRALEELSAIQKSRVFSSYLSILAQTSETGVSIKRSLTELSQNNLDYKRIALQEKVSKLSGKMSLVMMLCFFPALLILLVGPAVLNIALLINK